MKRFLLLLAVLGGCSNGQITPAPKAVTLSTSDLTLDLSDGLRCKVSDWQTMPVGRFDRCAEGFGYSVEVIDNPNVLRQIWAEFATALGAEDALVPLAKVVIEDPAGGKHVFASPPPDES